MKAVGLSTWAGTWKQGRGTISTTTDTFKDSPFSFASRFEGTAGSCPEELLAAAFAGCFNQALANNLAMLSFEADCMETSAAIEFGFGTDERPVIWSNSVTCDAKVSGISKEEFARCAEQARTRCTIARLLNIDPHVVAKLTT